MAFNAKKSYPQKKGYKLLAICKKTEKVFLDITDYSGLITKHVLSLYPEEGSITKSTHKQKELETNKYWYDNYFDFIYKVIAESKKCYYCDWLTLDVDNVSGAYEKHLLECHNICVDDYIKINPLDKQYFKHSTPEDAITCKICGAKLRMLNYTHLNLHNINIHDYRLKYGDNTVSKTTHDKLSISTIKKNTHLIKSKTSKAENIIKEFLVNNNIHILQSTRTYLDGIEIDLYSPADKIGIEYNGNLYHTEKYGKKTHLYHLNKSQIAIDKGIKLYHIHEDEWEEKCEMVKIKLLHIFNKSNALQIYARKCELRGISKKEKSDFLKANHLQGDDKSTHYFGAFYNNVLSAVMTFDNLRRMNKDKAHDNTVFELTRFAVKNDMKINGIGSRLLKVFIKANNPSRIVSFADRKWTPDPNNNLYIKLGFKCVEILRPDYSYYNRRSHRSGRIHKFGFGKSSIKKRFPEIFDQEKTEWEMMQELGYDRIWDCGKYKFELIINK